MEWYYIAGIAVVVVIALALILRARSGGQEEQSAPVPAQAPEARPGVEYVTRQEFEALAARLDALAKGEEKEADAK